MHFRNRSSANAFCRCGKSALLTILAGCRNWMERWRRLACHPPPKKPGRTFVGDLIDEINRFDVFQSVPKVALAPLVVVWLGAGNGSIAKWLAGEV